MIPDQTGHWNKKHSEGDHEAIRFSPSPLAQLVAPQLPPHSHTLELGCGVGRDAILFENQGHSVVATDASTVVIAQDKASFPDSNVAFEVLDMQEPLPYDDESFDVVFTNLALHYYGDKQTRVIVQNIARVLKPGGLIAFACKSVDEYRTADADEVEPDVFVTANDHALHVFSKAYTTEILDGLFDIKLLEEVEEDYLGRLSMVIRCIAVKTVEAKRG